MIVLAFGLNAFEAHASPPYRYYVLTPEHLASDLTVTSLEPGNTITAGSIQKSLGAYESAVISASALFPGSVISGTAKFTVGSNASAADLLAPDFLAGTEFVIPHITGSHRYFVQATTTTANLTIQLGATTDNLEVVPGTAYEIDAGSDNAIAGRITSDEPIVVAHVAYVSGVPQDAYPVPPASTELVGIRSQTAVVGAGTAGTSITVYASDGTSSIYSLDAGEKVAVTVGSNAVQGTGSALRIVANHPVAAVQYDDGDGADASAFWPTSAFAYRYAFPLNTQYVAVACLVANVSVSLFKGSTAPETLTCSASGTDPGKIYFGASTSGSHVAAGWYLHASAPVYVMHEATTPEDEHNLSGVQIAAGPSAPTLNSVTSPTTSNPLTITGTAGANESVRLYVNGRLQQAQTASGAGAFSFAAELFDGNNVVHAVAVSSGNESAPSNVLQVVYNNTVSRTQSGTVSGNVVWTPGSPATPYVISSTLTVAAGANLVLQPGATLRFANGTSLTVNGKLKIAGTSQSPVTLTSNAGSPTRGIWTGVVLNSTAAGSEISHAVIDWAATGVRVNGVAVTVRNSTIRNFPSNSGTGVWVVGSGASGTQIIGNTITGVSDQGRCILAEDSSPTITANTLTNCDRGIYVYRTSSPIISGNTIASNDNGIYVDGAGQSPQPIANGNQVSGNDVWNYFVTGFASGAQNLKLNANANWWGSSDPTAISALISDWSDAPASTTLPSVDYANRLNAADGSPIPGNYLIGPFTAGSTTLTAGATYEALGVLQIPSGKSLTVPAGTRVNFYSPTATLLVDGTFTLQGAAGNLAQMTSGRASPTRTDWAGIQVRAGSSVLVDYALIDWAANSIKVTGVAATISNSTIRNFTSVSGSGVWVSGSGGSGTQITGNLIQGVGDSGRCIFVEDSSPTIANNTLTDCDRGISVYRSSSPSITGNTINSNDHGIYVDGAGVSPQPIATGNQIFSNDTWNYAATNFATGAQNLKLNATGNWWGTTNLEAIGDSISDWSDNPNSTTVPSVDFSGLLDGPGGTPVAANYLVGPFTSSSTTLTAGTTYQALGVLQVPAGKSLTLQAGSRVNFYSPTATLIVDGTLTVQGAAGNLVQFTSGSATPTRTDWAGIQIRAGSTALIEYALVEWAAVGIKITGVAATIRNSTIRNFTSVTGAGIWVSGSGASGTQILDNVIQGVDDEGRCIFAEDSSPTITGNSLSDCDRGVSVFRSSSPTITGNTITSNDNGIYVDGEGVTPAPVATGNSIFANDTWNFLAGDFAAGARLLKVNATGNWWGSTDPTVIAAKVSDFNDDYTLNTRPTVDFTGFLDGIGGAPVAGNQLMGALSATTTSLTASTTYDVLGTMVVPASKTLIVAEGATLRFHAASALIVEGTLQVQGTSSALVSLTSGTGTPTSPDWPGVIVRSTATGVNIDYAEIEWAIIGVDVQSANASISNCLIHHFGTASISMTGSGASSEIADCTIDNYTKAGDGISLSASSPAITGNLVTRTNRAIYLSGASNPGITGNVLTGNQWGIYLFGNNSGSETAVPRPVINSNDIYGNTTAQVEVNAYGVGNTALIDATGNWWGTSTPTAGVQIKFTAGSAFSVFDFSTPAATSISFDSQPPSAPGSLSAFAASATEIQLSWPPSSDNVGVTSYSIERCSGATCTDFTEVGTSGTASYSDGGLTTSTHYRYRTRAKDAANLFGEYSPIAGAVAVLDTTAPTAPSALQAAAVSSTQVELQWLASTDDIGVATYLVERCEGSGCSDFTQVASVTTTSYSDGDVTAATLYRYRVRARDGALNPGNYSNVADATTSITGADCD